MAVNKKFKPRHPSSLTTSGGSHHSVRIKNVMGDITPEQYEKGFKMRSASLPVPEILAGTGMTRSQFYYLSTNPLPGHEDECPSYAQRGAEMVTELRCRAQEAAEEISKDAPKALKIMSETARIAASIQKMMLSMHAQEMQKQLVEPDLKQFKAINKDIRETLKVLGPIANFEVVGKAFRSVYESPHQSSDPISGLSKQVKLDLGAHLDPDLTLPATVVTMQAVKNQQDQGDAEYHQRLFRDFDGWSADELDAFATKGELPETEFGGVGEEESDDQLALPESPADIDDFD